MAAFGWLVCSWPPSDVAGWPEGGWVDGGAVWLGAVAVLRPARAACLPVTSTQWATHAEVDEEWKRSYPPMLRRQAAFGP